MCLTMTTTLKGERLPPQKPNQNKTPHMMNVFRKMAINKGSSFFPNTPLINKIMC